MTETIKDPAAGNTSAPGSTESLAPIAQSKRIDSMDILRGFALVGILFMNIEWFGRSLSDLGGFDTTLTGLDHAFGWLIRCFVEGKFYKLFALLFGMGFAVMLIRAREIGRPFGAWLMRRMIVLFVFGTLHLVFLWGGDILHDYAFAGMLFLGWIYLFQTKRLKRFDNPNAFLKIAIVWLSVPFVVGSIMALGFGLRFDNGKLIEDWQQDQHIAASVSARMESLPADIESTPPGVTGAVDVEALPVDENNNVDQISAAVDAASGDEETELTEEQEIEQTINEIVEGKLERDALKKEELEAFTHGTYWQATKVRLHHAGSTLQFTPVFSLLMLLPIFLLGYWLIASGTLRNRRDNHHIFKPMALMGMSFGLFFTIGGLTVIQHPVTEISGILGGTGEMMFFLGQYLLCAGYLGSIVILLDSPAWFRRLNHLAPMGRMALTNYITHSVILTTIFYGYAGGLFGQISRAPQMLIVLAIIVLQLFFSRWWLGRYRFGPLEWLWRSLTYQSLQPMRVAR